MTAAHTVYLILGSNQGDRSGQLDRARRLLVQAGLRLRKASPIYETASWGKSELPDHLNQALELQTMRTPDNLLHCIQDIERRLGRVRQEKWGLRSIDIDILFYDGLVQHRPELRIPHPLIAERRFVLAPLAAIAPDLRHPESGKTVHTLLLECSDPLAVRPITDTLPAT